MPGTHNCMAFLGKTAQKYEKLKVSLSPSQDGEDVLMKDVVLGPCT